MARCLQEAVFPHDRLSAFRLEMQQIIVEFRERRYEYTDEDQHTNARERETGITSRPTPTPTPALLPLPCCRTRPQIALADGEQRRQHGKAGHHTEQLTTSSNKSEFGKSWEIRQHDGVKGQDHRDPGGHNAWARLPCSDLPRGAKIMAGNAFLTITRRQVNAQVIRQADENRGKAYRENV